MNSSSSTHPRVLLKAFADAYPVFRGYQPLAIGINKELAALHPEVTPKALKAALLLHTRSIAYLKALEKATQRFALDGSPVGEVTAEHRQYATEQLREFFRKQNEARRKLEASKREAEAAQRAETLRQEKLTLLVSKFGGDRN